MRGLMDRAFGSQEESIEWLSKEITSDNNIHMLEEDFSK